MDKKRKGFSLVELIIVIAVIGVLAAILIPVFSNVIIKANQKSAFSDAKNALTQCITIFLDEKLYDTPDLLVFIHKGSNVYIAGYSSEIGGMVEYETAFEFDETKTHDSFDTRIDSIMDTMIDRGHVMANDTVSASELERVQNLINTVNTATLRVCSNMLLSPSFVPANANSITLSVGNHDELNSNFLSNVVCA